MKKGEVYHAPWPGGGCFKVKIEGAPGRWDTVLVRWQEGPLKDREGRVPTSGLRKGRIKDEGPEPDRRHTRGADAGVEETPGHAPDPDRSIGREPGRVDEPGPVLLRGRDDEEGAGDSWLRTALDKI